VRDEQFYWFETKAEQYTLPSTPECCEAADIGWLLTKKAKAAG